MNTLPCGNTTDDILYNLDNPPSLHELECRWCHQERRRLKDQNDSILSQFHTTEADAPHDVVRRVMTKVTKIIPKNRTWEVKSSQSGEIQQITAREIIAKVRQQFSQSQTTQLNYMEIRATDTKIPHTIWLARCTVSMFTESNVAHIENEVLQYVTGGLNALVVTDHLTVEITVEDIHGDILGNSTIQI